MILTGSEIKKQVADRKIHIEPFCAKYLNPNSYNYHLDATLLELVDTTIDPKNPCSYKNIEFNNEGYVLQPDKIYLANTLEVIGSEYYVTSLIGRSSLGRLGLFLQITADLGNLGAIHRWTLELKVVQPLKIYPMMPIGQVSFWCPCGVKQPLYNGNYGKYFSARCSEIYQEML